jgi:DNA polymerase III epsilon subunit-like protein
MIYISIDIETTGLDWEKCQILEFGAVLEDTNNVLPLEDLPTYHAYIKHPGGNLFGNIFALNLNADIIEKLNNEKVYSKQFTYLNVDELADDFLAWLNLQGIAIDVKHSKSETIYSAKINVAGKNFNGFDRYFLDRVPGFSKKIKMRTRVIDPAVLYVDWNNDDALPSLDQCKERANIDGVVTHLAVEDALDVIKTMRKFY